MPASLRNLIANFRLPLTFLAYTRAASERTGGCARTFRFRHAQIIGYVRTAWMAPVMTAGADIDPAQRQPTPFSLGAPVGRQTRVRACVHADLSPQGALSPNCFLSGLAKMSSCCCVSVGVGSGVRVVWGRRLGLNCAAAREPFGVGQAAERN